MNFLKTTALGGVVFLIPFVVLLILLGKALELARGLVTTIEARIPMVSVGDFVLLNLVGIFLIALLCFLAGLVARSAPGRRLGAKLEAQLLTMIPGYSFVNGLANSMRTSEQQSREFVPVIARFDDNAQLGFEVERSTEGIVVVYMPGCPDPWSGSILYVEAERVTALKITVGEALKSIRTLGRGSAVHMECS